MASIKKRPDGQWRARYRDPSGKEHARHFARQVDTERWVRTVETAKDRGEWIDPALGRITFAEWVSRWEATVVDLRASTRTVTSVSSAITSLRGSAWSPW